MDNQYRVPLEDAEEAGKILAKGLRGGEILALIGPLGAGKTTFTKALGKALGVRRRIASPTFVLMQKFPAFVKNRAGRRKPVTLYHLDLYRTRSFREVEALGITESWGRPDTVTVIEWAGKIRKHLPPHTTTIRLRHRT